MKRILIIDDDPSMIANMIEVLDFEGFETQSVSDSREALDHARNFQPDLIFSDIKMPGMNGYAVLEALRGDPYTVEIPLVFLTGFEDPNAERQIEPDGMLMKPFSIEQLLQTIQQYAR
jgi:twitching motility two-component system response regulator PilH